MKWISTLLLFLSLTTVLLAVKIGDRIQDVTNEINNSLDKRTELTSAKKVLDQTSDRLDFGVAAFKKQTIRYKADRTDLEMDEKSYEEAVDTHNANQCVEHDNDGSCAAYQAEKRELDARKDALVSRENSLKTTGGLLKTLADTITEQTEKWATDAKRYNADVADNEARLQRLAAELKDLRIEHDKCATTAGRAEKVVETCGAPFDRNKVHPIPPPPTPFAE